MRIFLALVICLAACEKDKSQKAAAGKDTKATPDKVAPASPLDAAISKLDLSKIYGCVFEKGIYEYSFDSDEFVTISGKTYSRFAAGIGGIMYYSDFVECASGVPIKHHGDVSGIETLAGMPIKSPTAPADAKFTHLNPELVKWGYRNLIPEPDIDIGGVPSQKVYDVVMSRFFQLKAESYLALKSRDDFDALVSEYKTKADEDFAGYSYGAIDYLEEKYAGWLPTYPTPADGTKYTRHMAIGFWIRRSIDGTDDELWDGLKIALKQYDQQFYAALKSKYPSAKVTW